MHIKSKTLIRNGHSWSITINFVMIMIFPLSNPTLGVIGKQCIVKSDLIPNSDLNCLPGHFLFCFSFTKPIPLITCGRNCILSIYCIWPSLNSILVLLGVSLQCLLSIYDIHRPKAGGYVFFHKWGYGIRSPIQYPHEWKKCIQPEGRWISYIHIL